MKNTAKKIGFVTSEVDPNLIADDRLAFAPLQQHGINVEPVVWDQRDVKSLAHLDALIFRSCWNYHRKPDSFIAWLNAVKAAGLRCFNSIDQNLENLNKKYLLELAQKGVKIPQTLLLEKNEVQSRDEALAMAGKIQTAEIVIKPALSLNGENTYLLNRHTDTDTVVRIIRELNQAGAVLLQEYIHEIKTHGEVSLIFFNKKFSHALKKTPKDGEFRIHAEHGGTHVPYSPDAQLLAQAEYTVNTVSHDLLFCRVDVVPRASGAVLIELEILDPMLFLGMEAGAPARFAAAIAEVL